VAVSAPASPKRNALRPRDAATLILFKHVRGQLRILIGQRRVDQVFLPGKYVFRAGRLETHTSPAETPDPPGALQASDLAILAIGERAAKPLRPRALAIAALRETFEETGLFVGTVPRQAKTGAQAWSEMLASGALPDLSAMRFVARAITPPGRPRRYDTRFFCAPSSAIGFEAERTDGELSNLGWLSLQELRELDLASITRSIVDDLDACMGSVGKIASNWPVPFYFERHGRSQRAILSHNRPIA
jgi:8-oxo-dGTP pyrophosphatase MutT (NUDIX family)